ncbi:TRAP transporter small permease [Petrocella sp. FN5]|uniref:TRAP transporter small permease n=1 Tax=Petrocella sp. FN5 TaxID=3032002 RepID=UPI0023DA92A0|nr:TRAP transporter small permease subunit [Petrocella sp. FN5]MDF1617060.1 TRAP transporter small permease subunit [Petrocella sp. FN5]
MKRNSILNKIHHILEIISIVAFIALIVVVTLQIIGRTPLMNKPYHWTEELTRMIFIFLISISSITAVLHNEFVAVDVVPSLFKGRRKLIYEASVHFVVGGFLLYLIPAANKFTQLGGRQLSAGLRVNMMYIHSFVFICIVGMGIANVYIAIRKISAFKKYKEDVA